MIPKMDGRWLVALLGFAAPFPEGPSAATAGVPAEARLTLETVNAPTANACAGDCLEFRILGPLDSPAHGYSTDLVAELVVTAVVGPAIRVPAFPFQPFEHARRRQGAREVDWVYPVGPKEWRARFAARGPGRHTARAVAILAGRTIESAEIAFECLPASGPGYVRVSKRDPRFLEFDQGQPFFALGQNLAFIGNGQYLDTGRAGQVFEKMADNGANCARVWVCCEDWALGIEARKSAWGRSWDWNPPFGFPPGREEYHRGEPCVVLDGTTTNLTLAPANPIALRGSTEYELTLLARTGRDTTLEVLRANQRMGDPVRSSKPEEWTRHRHRFVTGPNEVWLGELGLRRAGSARVYVRALSLREAGGGPELLEEADPARPVRGTYHQVDSFLLDRLLELARQQGIYLQLCLFTRDHYMGDLRDPTSARYHQAVADARRFLRYALARWGWSPHVLAWEYFNEIDPGLPLEPFHRQLGDSLAAADPYRHPRTTSAWGPAPKHWTHEQIDLAQLHWYLRPTGGPLWQDEVGAVLDRTALLRQQAPRKPAFLAEFGLADDRWGLSPHMAQDGDGLHIHNSLWASAFSGLSGSVMFWWWETFDQLDAYRHYRPLATFLADVPFVAKPLEPAVLETDPSGCRVLAWKGTDCFYGWIVNPQSTWYRTVVEKQKPPPIEGDRLRMPGLPEGSYAIDWWDTWEGRWVRQETVQVTGAQTELSIPGFGRDLALRIEPR